MNFLDFEIKGAKQGAVAHIALSGVESDVMLMTASNVNANKQGRQVHYWGGRYDTFPARIAIPHAGEWHVLVVPGPDGRVRATLSVQ